MWAGHLRRLKAAKPQIELSLEYKRSINSGSYRTDQWARKLEKHKIDKIFEDRTPRIGVEFCKLKAKIIWDSYLLWYMDVCINYLGHVTICYTSDGNQGCWKLKVTDVHLDKTTVASHNELFSFNLQPFALWDAPRTIGMAMDIMLSSVKLDFTLVCLDDAVVFSKSPHELIDQVHQVFKLFNDAG